MLMILGSWLVLTCAFIGVGLLLISVCRRSIINTEDIVSAFWPGWAATLGLLQLWHLFFKISEWALLIVIAFSILGWALKFRAIWTVVKTKSPLTVSASILIFLAVGLWLAGKADGPTLAGDTPRYHMQVVLWNLQYRVVPGLGNIDDRFGFNSSYFLYSALVSLARFKHLGCNIASGLLVYTLLGQMLISLFKLVVLKTDRTNYLFLSLLLGPLTLWILGPDMLGVPFMLGYAPELPVFVIGIVLCWEVFKFLRDGNKDQNEVGYRLVFITLLAAAGITIKLSMFALSISAWLVALVIWIRRQSRGGGVLTQRKFLLASGAIWIALIIPWMARGVILSGYVAFPSTFGAFPVEWKMQRQTVLNEANWVKGWAKSPNKHWVEVLDNRGWFDGWLDRLPREITKASWLGLWAFLIGIILLDYNGPSRGNANWLFLLIPISSICFWFFSAPDPRFAGSSFWIFAAGSICLVFDQITGLGRFERFGRLLACFVACVFFAYVAPPSSEVFASQGKWTSIAPQSEWLSRIEKEYQSRTTFSGLEFNVPPAWTDCCADAPIPCTPHPNPYLTLIQSGNPGRGFKISAESPLPSVKGIMSPPLIGIEGLTGWYDYEGQTGVRWMKSPARMAIYTEADETIRLTMIPILISNGTGFGIEGNLRIFINGEIIKRLSLTARKVCQIEVAIQSGYNILRMELDAPNLTFKQINPSSKDDRERAISFEGIEITLPYKKTGGDQSTNNNASPFLGRIPLSESASGTRSKEYYITRSEIAQQIIDIKYGEHFDFPEKSYFSDVPPNHPLFRYIQRFRLDRITAGPTDDGSRFGPDDPVTRYMLATFLVRARYGETFNFKDDDRFADLPRSHANYRYALRAVDDGILQPCGPNRFCPDDWPRRTTCDEAISKYLGHSRIRK